MPTPHRSPPRLRIGVDIGGTFTDIVVLDDTDGRVLVRKVSSTVDDYARAIADGLARLFADEAIPPDDVGEVIHATTVASNAILELKGARAGLITTRGFRDVLDIRSLRMPRLYDLAWRKPAPLVERYLRLEVDERVNVHGGIERPLDTAGVERAVRRLLDEEVDAIAVCLLHSYANPAHERLIGEVIRRLAPDLPFCLSCDVLPEIKEYDRTSTTVINTYVMPIVASYVARLRDHLDDSGLTAPLLIMQSNGGLTPAESARRLPMNIIESGPAAGVVGAQALARRMELRRVITLDMGGTTAKASLVEDGAVLQADEYQVGGGILMGSRLMTGAGYRLKVPAIDLAEVGAGGGSIVTIDAGGAPQVGPESAGALPGPLCYDLGGEEPTVTDANLILGYINPTQIAGGAVRLNAERARRIFQEKVADRLGLPLEQAAHGAYLIASSNMIRAIKAVTSERGRDPRDYDLFAFGGNGPVFAAGMAAILGIRRILVPPAPGLFSAFGLLYTDVEHHYSRTFRRLVRALDPDELNAALDRMSGDALAQLASEGFVGERAQVRRTAKLHYHGQSFELPVSLPPGPLDGPGLRRVEEAFGAEHERTYGHRAGPDEPVEVVTLQVVGRGVPDRPRVPERLRFEARTASEETRRPVYFGPATGWLDTPILSSRAALDGGRAGPLIVEEYDATCVVPPGARASLDGFGNIAVEMGDG
ncbi:MAG TPA: hydantoinase/oxoprolinase family protein [Geminicoccaceae bacterium]|nr:hydantoinase/oxoprolinase family protein [Geminicoccaceae bacterium]